MSLQLVAGYLGQAGLSHPVQLFRNVNAAIAGGRTGAIRYNDFALTPSGSAMQMTIGSGEGVIIGQEASTQGGYFVWSNLAETVAWPAAAGSPRYDTLLCRVVDTDYGSDPGGSKAYWDVVSGTPAGSPVPLADSQFNSGGGFYKPGAWWRVADVLVPSGVTNLSTATINHKRKYARVGRHTMVLVTDYPGDAQLGDTLTQIDGVSTGKLFHYNGSSWERFGGTGLWQNATPTVYQNAGTTPSVVAGANYTVDYYRYLIRDRTVKVKWRIQIKFVSVGGLALGMPQAAAQRDFGVGMSKMIGVDAATDTLFLDNIDQTDTAWFLPSPNLDKIVLATWGGGFINTTNYTAGKSYIWIGDVEYEI